jgi:hypothetical protein
VGVFEVVVVVVVARNEEPTTPPTYDEDDDDDVIELDEAELPRLPPLLFFSLYFFIISSVRRSPCGNIRYIRMY